MNAIILAAGVGTRLGSPFPKTLSKLPSGERIMGRQIHQLRTVGLNKITVAAGFKKSLIMEEYPDVFYSYNPFFYVTNNCKTLLQTIRYLDEDILWINCDVVFDTEILQMLLNAPDENILCVDKKQCGDEEMKYSVGADGSIHKLSKTITDGLGESMGIHLVRRRHLPAFIKALTDCNDNEYFEKGIQMCIDTGITFLPLDVSAYRCIEVDFPEDLEAAKKLFPES